MTILPGYWCDVLSHPEGIGLLVFEPAQGTHPHEVTLYVNGFFRATAPIPDSLLYLRACADPHGDVSFIAQPGSDQNQGYTMIGVIGAPVLLLKVPCFSRPAIGWNGTEFIHYCQTSARTWKRFTLAEYDTQPNRAIPVWQGGDGTTSQGFGQVETHPGDGENDQIVWHDQMARVTRAGVTMINAMSAEGVIVGQGQESGMVGVNAGAVPFLAMDFAPQEPRIAFSPVRQVWAVCSHDLTPRVGYNELPPFPPLVVPVPVDPTAPPTTPIVTFPGYKPEPQASYGRKGYCGPYFATDLRAGNFTTPGNTEIIVNGTVLGGNQQVDRPVIVGLACTGNDPAKMVGFMGGLNDASMGNTALVACWKWLAGSAMFRYYDGPSLHQEFIDKAERDAIICIQGYPLWSETADETVARVLESVERVRASKRRWGLVRAFNVKFGGPNTLPFSQRLSRVLDLQSPFCSLVRDFDGVADFWFSAGRWATTPDGKIIVDCGAAYCQELKDWEPILGGLFKGLP